VTGAPFYTYQHQIRTNRYIPWNTPLLYLDESWVDSGHNDIQIKLLKVIYQDEVGWVNNLFVSDFQNE
jgi:hypothetical protein